MDGIAYAGDFQASGMQAFGDYLSGRFKRELTQRLHGSNNGVSWYDELLERHDGDQDAAFQEFIQLLREMAAEEKLTAPDAEALPEEEG